MASRLWRGFGSGSSHNLQRIQVNNEKIIQNLVDAILFVILKYRADIGRDCPTQL